jgi:hypothetical protein
LGAKKMRSFFPLAWFLQSPRPAGARIFTSGRATTRRDALAAGTNGQCLREHAEAAREAVTLHHKRRRATPALMSPSSDDVIGALRKGGLNALD